MDPLLSDDELHKLTGYKRGHEQLQALHKRGFVRAYRNALGRVCLTRAHYEAVERGELVRPVPTLRPTRQPA